MAYITPAGLSLEACFQSYYSLPYFQREYKWELKHFSELFDDIQQAFLAEFDPMHGRTNVSSYTPYFLGSIITSKEVQGKKPLIDGQQRLTSIAIIIAFLERFKLENNITDTADLSTLLFSFNYGSSDYKIDFSRTRKAVFDAYLKKDTKTAVQALSDAEDIVDLDDGDKRIIEFLRDLEQLFDTRIKSNIAFFIDYFIKKVQVIEIAVEDEAEAHRVFVTMNDRGLRLGPIELLKGRVLSSIANQADIQLGHRAWADMISELQEIGPEEDSLFFRQFLRAKYANTVRGKAKGSPAGDFDLINDEYHRWFEGHAVLLGLSASDDYKDYVIKTLPFFANIYSFIKSAESKLVSGFEHLYYNAIRKYSFQSMVLLASINIGDNDQVWKSKISLVAKFIDAILTSRTIEGKENNYDNLKLDAFELSKAIRNKDYASLQAYIRGEWPKYAVIINDFHKVAYKYNDRADVLYLLARVACYLETELQIANKVGFVGYMQRDKKGRTFDIEHIFKEPYDVSALPANHGFTDAKEYASMRNQIGALILLPRSRNRSIQDKAYRDKLSIYGTENILAQTLGSDFYQNNPSLRRFLASKPTIILDTIADFGKADIATRGNTYTAIANEIWSVP